MKSMMAAIAASMLTIIALLPRPLAAAARSMAAGVGPVRSVAEPRQSIELAQYNPDMRQPEASQDDGTNLAASASGDETDNPTDSGDQNATEDSSNADPDSDSDQNAQADDNGDNGDPDSVNSADAQPDAGGTDENADSGAAQNATNP